MAGTLLKPSLLLVHFVRVQLYAQVGGFIVAAVRMLVAVEKRHRGVRYRLGGWLSSSAKVSQLMYCAHG